MTIVLDDARVLLRTVIRSIDRKVDFTATLHEGDRPGVSVTLSLQKDRATIVIPQEQIEAATENTMRRSELRTLIKRAIDRMSFKTHEFADTKMVRRVLTDDGFFRPRQSGQRGGRR